ncbi:MAG: MFS transporter [Lentimicrobiaceae bacterium]|jgi:multidrug resistance protein
MQQHRNGKILALLFTGVLMGALDISIVGPAIPAIEQTLKVDHRSLSWIFSIYVLFNLVGVSFLAKLSDLYGRRNIYILSVAVFAFGSTIVALSDNITFLLIGRAVQGFGSSGIFPVASAVIGDIYPPEKRGRTLGMIGAVFGIAFIIGPVIAGVLLLWFKWNALFLINLPIAAVVIFYSWRLLPTIKSDIKPYFDWPGMVFIALLLSSFAYGINNIEAAEGFQGIFSIKVIPFLLITIITLPVLIFLEKRSPSPVVKIELFDVKQIRIVGLVAFGTGIIQAVTIFVPEMAVSVFGVSTSQASFMLIPFVLAIAVGSPVAGRLIDKIGSRAIVMSGLMMAATGLLVFYYNSASVINFYTAGIFMGLGSAMLQGSALRYIMLNEVQASERALGQGIITLFTSTGQMTGATLIGIVVASVSTRLDGYSRSFLIIALIALSIMFLSYRLKSRKDELTHASATIE